MSRDAFGPNLRRIRKQKRITIEEIAHATKISGDLLRGLEKNDFSRWPEGIYARAYIRQYAYAIGVDPDSTVDEFCRWYTQGDRRAERTVRGQAEIVGHEELKWQDDTKRLSDGDRRGGGARRARHAPPVASPIGSLVLRLRRALGRA
jgi:transcriptional regulator with XRE-family HTH domain